MGYLEDLLHDPLLDFLYSFFLYPSIFFCYSYTSFDEIRTKVWWTIFISTIDFVFQICELRYIPDTVIRLIMKNWTWRGSGAVTTATCSTDICVLLLPLSLSEKVCKFESTLMYVLHWVLFILYLNEQELKIFNSSNNRIVLCCTIYVYDIVRFHFIKETMVTNPFRKVMNDKKAFRWLPNMSFTSGQCFTGIPDTVVRR